jgi:predicted 3-demethylubiquinone-9 3-methyltransferase (glyoxalase superfamily)
MTVTGLTTFLWFDQEAEEAAHLYVSLFPQSRIGNISRYPEGSRLPDGTVMTIEFEIFGQSFTCLNGGPMFPHSEAVSFQVSCDTQEEVDHLWNSLIADGGAESQCGWCKDKFGVSWQIIPKALSDALSSNDSDISSYAMQAMMKMGKIIIKDLYLKQ